PACCALECLFPRSRSSFVVRAVLAQTFRTAVYGPVRTVVWQGSVGDRRPYADLTAYASIAQRHVDGMPTMRPVESNPTATLTMELTGPPRKADRGVRGTFTKFKRRRGVAKSVNVPRFKIGQNLSIPTSPCQVSPPRRSRSGGSPGTTGPR